MVRPPGRPCPADPPGPDVPASSFVYTTFSDGTSAAIWRSWDQQAIPLGGGDSDRQSLVARVLVGDVTTLPPVTALALGFVGWPGITGPEPGQVQPDDRLPVIAGDELPVLIAQAGAGLEAAADRLQGLEFLLAQALRDGATPLSVLLPKRLVTHPLHSGPQAPMLWALLHTVRPLLDGQDDAEAATRAWTFSTYEPPLGRSDTRWLANIVFRADQQARPPQITRNEITVRPWDRGQHPPSDQPTQIARLLQTAYRQIGAEPVAQFLAGLAATCPDRHERLAVAQQRLAAMVNEPDGPGDRNPTVATTVPPRRVAPTSSAPGPDSAFDGRAAVDPGFERPAYAETGQAYAAAAYQDRIRHEAAYHEYEEDPLAAGTSGGTDPDLPDQLAWAKAMRSAAATAGSAGHPGADGVPAPPEHRDPRDQEGRPRTGVLNLLHRLTQNPEESAFREAVAMLRHGDGPLADPEARAEARYVLPRRGWYVPVLVRHDPQCVDPALTTLFTLTVIPDLRVQGVADDVARWGW